MNTIDAAYELDDLGIDVGDIFIFLDNLVYVSTFNLFAVIYYMQVEFGLSSESADKLLYLWRLDHSGELV